MIINLLDMHDHINRIWIHVYATINLMAQASINYATCNWC